MYVFTLDFNKQPKTKEKTKRLIKVSKSTRIGKIKPNTKRLKNFNTPIQYQPQPPREITGTGNRKMAWHDTVNEDGDIQLTHTSKSLKKIGGISYAS